MFHVEQFEDYAQNPQNLTPSRKVPKNTCSKVNAFRGAPPWKGTGFQPCR
jgi:hypothetical protein